MKLDQIQPVDVVENEKIISSILLKCTNQELKIQDLNKILSMIDLTTLDGKDTENKVRKMCSKAANLHSVYNSLDTVAAICVYSSLIKSAKNELINSTIKLASVSTGFPSGQTLLPVKLVETQLAIEYGADEIDMVISRGKFLDGEYNFVFDEIAAVKDVCGNKTLKVILETGELETLDNVRKASEIAIYAGADFIKTSTGKIAQGATMQVTLVMLQVIQDYFTKTGIKIGIKPSGGLSSIEVVLPYFELIKEVLGEQWQNSSLVRFGASSLANIVLEEILKIQFGKDQSTDYFLFG